MTKEKNKNVLSTTKEKNYGTGNLQKYGFRKTDKNNYIVKPINIERKK